MGDNDNETLSNVSLGEFDFDDDVFDEVSDDAKNFIEFLLQPDQKFLFLLTIYFTNKIVFLLKLSHKVLPCSLL